MADTSITSSNSILTLSVSLFPVPFEIQGFSSDRAFATESLKIAEVLMGVDGKLSAGYTPEPSVQTITLQADSPSRFFFTTLLQATKIGRMIYYLNGTLSIPSTKENFSLNRGVLTSLKQIPDGQKILQPIDYVITWESVTPSPL